MKIRLGKIAALIIALSLPGMASAFVVYDQFGAFPNADFGGSGIPNDAVAASKQIIFDPGDGSQTTITIAMNATERYSNPAVGDNGAGVYYAGTGSNCGSPTDPVGCPAGPPPQGAAWNWNYYIGVVNTVDPNVKLRDYQIDIYYDFNPAGPNALGDLVGLGKIDVTAALNCGGPCGVADSDADLAQDSQNLLFGFLATTVPGLITAPAYGPFDPNATGNYQFAITVSSAGGLFPIDSVAIEVEVVPVPAAAWLFGSALMLLGWVRRRMA